MKFIERFSRKSSQQPQPADAVQAPLLMALEPRIMFDASVGVVAQDAAADVATDTAKDSTSADKTTTPAASAASSGEQNTPRQEVVFVDSQVGNVGELLQGLSGNAEVVILDPNKDGLQQMADYLQGREGLDAIHLLSHGADGSVQMGNLWLASSNLSEHRQALESIGATLKADGDFMLYGCRVGESAQGQAFLDQLAQITGADVAASADDTGAASLGGNWTLERTSGVIETTALGAQLQGYEGLLAVSFSGGLNNTGPTLGVGELSRMVIGDFNNDGRDDILYQTGGDGTPWRFAAGNVGGTFTTVDKAQSPFAGVAMENGLTNGNNYYAADFDKDGDTDLLAVVPNGAAYLYRNNNGVFAKETASTFLGTQYGGRLAVGDFDGDGAADILYQPGNVDMNYAWRYAKNNGDGTFTDVPQAQSPFAAFTLGSFSSFNYRVVDFDGDGDLDIMWTANNNKGTLYINNGGTFTLGSTTGFPSPAYGGRTLWGDFDGDGDADVLWQIGTTGSEWNYGLNNGDGTFTTIARASSPFAGLAFVDFPNSNFRTGDFDGDGDLDVIGIGPDGSSYLYIQSGQTPRLVSATPADNSLNVSPGANIVLTFSESVAKGTGNIYIVSTSNGQVVQTIPVTSGQVTGSGTTWTVDPSDLAQGTAYAVRIDSKTFLNADGKIYTGIQNNTALNFTTATVQVPVIANLHGDSVNYTEDAAFTLLDLNGNATVSDADSSNFSGGKLTVQVTAGGTAGEDVLFIRNQGSGLNEIQVDGFSIKYNGFEIGTYTGGTSGAALVITLTNNANATTTAALVHNLAYRNSNTIQPSTTSRSVSISMDDGAGGNSAVSVVSLAVLAVNDAPVVNATGTNPTYTENGSAVVLFSGTTINTVETGQFIKQMMFTVTGLLDGSLERLTIDGTQVNLVSGTNVVTLNNSTTVTVSLNSGTALVTLTHSGLASATAQTIVNNMTYNNASEGPSGSSRVVTLFTVTDTGGVANAGADAVAPGITSTVTLISINDAPTLSGGPYVMTPVNEETVTTSYQVSSILGSMTYGDLDPGYLSGIAVTSTVGRGTWQYSTDGSTWTDFGAVLSTSSLLLSSTTQVRYVPDAANGENVSMTFRAWDRTTGTASTSGVRSTADTTSNGGSTSFSTGTAQATLAVSSVNDAPVMLPLAPTLSGLTDTSTNNAGSSVLFLLGGVTDVDTGALYGMAITSVTATYGKWQYSTNAGGTWSDVGSVSVTSALLLTAQNMVRFVPDGIHGETASITYKAWDQTNSTLGLQGTKTTTTTSGGTSAFSSATDTATVVVTGVNDRPVVTLTGTAALWSEGNNVASTPIPVDSGVTVSDPDGPNPLSATVRMLTYYSPQDVLAFTNDGNTMGNIVGNWNPGTGILTLTSAGNLATLAQFQAAMRSVTYNNISETPTTISRTVEFQLTDGGSLSSIAVTRDITISAVNDSPTITAPVTFPVSEDVVTPITGITFSDVDSSTGTVTLSVGSGTLSATSTTDVTVSGTPTALILSGTLANINTFISDSRVTFTTAANATSNVTLTINVNTTSVSDATTTTTLQVTAVNDAPVITVPPSITVTEDVASVITGMSFTDIDAGINIVEATFSVPSGTLSATTGLGVTVTGSGTGELTLSGSLSDINFFVSANGVTFKTAQDATASVILTVKVNDKGFSGSGGEQIDTKTVTLNVTAVNDAPVNNLPAAQTASQNLDHAFNTANGNAISISDVDSGNGLMSVTLTAVNGTLSLGSLTGINMVYGTGQNSTSMTFEGNRTNINAALQTLTFRPTSNYLGFASLTIETNDNGNSGTGGAKSDVDTLSITVVPVNPKVTNVSAQGLDRTVKIGDEVLISMVWDQVVNVDLSSGIPSLLLETGLVDRNAVYVSGTGTNTLVFKYTVQAGDITADLDFQSTAALQMNGAVISNNTSDLAVLTLPTVGGADSLGGRSNIVVDGMAPVVGSVSAPTNGTYITGQNLDFTVNFSEAMTVDTSTGVPRIAVTLDTGGTVYAEYVSGSGGSALVFRLTVASGQLDSNGITLGSSIELNNGAITDLAGNTAVTTLNGVASTTGVNVDGVAPTVVSVTPPADGGYPAGGVLTFTVKASEAVQTGSLAPRLVLDVGGVTRYANYVSGSGSDTLVFQYVVQAGDNDTDGVALSSLDLRGEQLTDLAGNDLNLNLNGVGNMTGVRVDTTAPLATGLAQTDASPTGSAVVRYTLSFSERVNGIDASDFELAFTGNANGAIESITSVDGQNYIITVGGLSGAGQVRLDLKSGTDIADVAGNLVTTGLAGGSYTIDRIAPTVTTVAVPGNGTYVAGQNLDFTVKMSEVVVLDSSNGSPRIEVTLDNGQKAYASYLSGAGSDTLVFRLAVTNGLLDSNGISLAGGIDLNGSTLRDALGNDAQTAFNGLPPTSGILVDAVAPVVSSVGLPASGAYNAGDVLRFTVNASENVVVDTSSGTPRLALNVGGVTRYANYVSGNGTSALVFEYTVQAGNNASAGIGLPGSIDLNGSTLRDAAGNNMNLQLNAPGTASGVVVDTVAPQVSDIVRVDITPTNAGSLRYTVTFDESVSGVDSADFTLALTGTAAGRIASVTRIDGRTYQVLVDNLSGAGNVRLDLNASNTGITDVAGNPITGGLDGSSYSIDRVAPSVTSVTVPASGTYTAGKTLDFTVNTDEAVLVDSGDGNPRLAITLDNGRVVYADYLSGSGTTALTFRLTVTSGMAGNSSFAVASSIDTNGGTLRDARGNDANTGLNNVGSTSGILVDARAPRPSGIVVDGPVAPGDRTLSFTLTFDEAVSGVDAGDFSVLGTSSASGVVQSVQQIDAKTYRIVVGDMRGQGALSLSLNAPNSGIQDGAGNLLAQSLTSPGQSVQSQDVGDLEFRVNPPATTGVPQAPLVQPQVPGLVISESISPLVPGSLFEVRTVGGSLQPLGTIFLGQAGSAPSFIAQVFGSSDGGLGNGAGQGFLGFGGGNGGIFGGSTFATIFGREVPGVTEMNVFNGGQWKQSDLNQGLRGVFGVPTFGQQLQQINEADQRHVRELAKALAKPAEIGQRA